MGVYASTNNTREATLRCQDSETKQRASVSEKRSHHRNAQSNIHVDAHTDNRHQSTPPKSLLQPNMHYHWNDSYNLLFRLYFMNWERGNFIVVSRLYFSLFFLHSFIMHNPTTPPQHINLLRSNRKTLKDVVWNASVWSFRKIKSAPLHPCVLQRRTNRTRWLKQWVTWIMCKSIYDQNATAKLMLVCLLSLKLLQSYSAILKIAAN